MINTILESFDIWTRSQTIKSNGRTAGVDNQRMLGIDKLRELILELAFTGKLCENENVKHDYNSILKLAKEEKISFHKRRNVQLQKFEPLKIEYPLLDLPSNWAFIHIDDVIVYITDFQANGSFADLRKNVQYFDSKNFAILIRLKDLRKNLESESDFVYTDKKGYDYLSKSVVYGGEIVVANVGAGVGTTLEIPKIDKPATLAPNMFMIILSNCVDKEYFKYFSKSPLYWRHINQVNVGTGQPKINKREYKSCKIPFPPLAEQHRIVAKVDELMALCDQLEQQQTESNATHQQLVELLLTSLTEAQSPEAFTDAWQRITLNFDTLFTTEYSIDRLKQTILQLAVMGKLVPQDPNDEPAKELLKKIAWEKERLVKEGKIKKQEKLPEIMEEEKPFELPKGWEWVRLGAIGLGKTGSTPSTNKQEYFNGQIPFIGPGQITNCGDILNSEKFLTEKGSEYSTIANYGDIIMVCIGGSIGKSAIVTNKLTFNQQINCISPIISLASYLYLNVNSPHFQKELLKKATGSATPIINRKKWEELLISVPPLSEQHRIVAKVDELFALCDALKARIKEAQEVQGKMAEGVGEGVLG